MDKNQTEKSQAELYREERKQRMAKAAKKNSTKSPQLTKLGRIAGRCCGILIIVALCVAVIYGTLSFFGVPQKVLTATKVGDEKVSVAKYNFYYYDIFNQVYSQAKQYEQYGEGMGLSLTGYDITKAPSDQEYVSELEGYSNPTWADYLKETTLDYLQSYIAYADLAKENGVTLTDEQKSEVEEQISSIRETAEDNDYSLNRYLTKIYGKGVNEKLMREIIEERSLAYNYAVQMQEEYTSAVTSEEIDAEYTENIKTYTTFGVSLFEVEATEQSLADDATEEEIAQAQTNAMNEAKALADGYLAKVTDSASMLALAKTNKATASEDTVYLTDTNASTISSSYGDKAVEWIYDSARKVGDKAVVETDDGYLVIYMTSLPARETRNAVDVRHILVAFEDSDSDLTDSEKASYYSKAQEIYNSYLENPTEDNFAALANEKSEDTGSNTTGGLYENVAPGDMVDEFNDWIFDESRKAGDTGIIETSYGYHIMYFVSNDNEQVWQINCRAAIAQTKFADFDTEILEGETYALKNNDSNINWAVNLVEDTVKSSLASNS